MSVMRAHTDETYRDLQALEAIEDNPRISQRELARSMGVALGVANACIRALARKGLVKIRGENNRSISYHLTKEGRLQKARLAMEWTGNTIDFYIQARGRVGLVLDNLASRGVTDIVTYGANEAAELVALLAPHSGIKVHALISAEGERIADELLGVSVVELSAVKSAQVQAVLACVVPSESVVLDLRAGYPGVPIVLLNGEILEESSR